MAFGFSHIGQIMTYPKKDFIFIKITWFYWQELQKKNVV